MPTDTQDSKTQSQHRNANRRRIEIRTVPNSPLQEAERGRSPAEHHGQDSTGRPSDRGRSPIIIDGDWSSRQVPARWPPTQPIPQHSAESSGRDLSPIIIDGDRPPQRSPGGQRRSHEKRSRDIPTYGGPPGRQLPRHSPIIKTEGTWPQAPEHASPLAATQNIDYKLRVASNKVLMDIYSLAGSCRYMLHWICGQTKDSTPSGIESKRQMTNFNAWIATVGIPRGGYYSMASLLRLSPKHCNDIKEVLENLNNLLRMYFYCQSICKKESC